jgi:outer membrane lipoprotein
MHIKKLEVIKMDNKLHYKGGKHPGRSGMIVASLLGAFIVTGCAHIISEETMKEVDRGISFEQLVKDPMKYKGKAVLLGGVIVKTENRKDGTLLELYQTNLDNYGAPINADQSEGRFLAMDERFLDSEIYRAGRRVTVAGMVAGTELIKLGELDYSCPYIAVKEIHLWKEQPRGEYGPRYRDYGGPFWGWGYPWHRWYYPYWPYTGYYYYEDYGRNTGRVVNEGLNKSLNKK